MIFWWTKLGRNWRRARAKKNTKKNLSLSDQPVGGHKRWGGGLRWGRDWAKSGDMRAARNTLFVLPTLFFTHIGIGVDDYQCWIRDPVFLWLNNGTKSKQEARMGGFLLTTIAKIVNNLNISTSEYPVTATTPAFSGYWLTLLLRVSEFWFRHWDALFVQSFMVKMCLSIKHSKLYPCCN